MGKRLKQQRRGSASPRYRSPYKRFKVDLNYRNYDDMEKTGMLIATVTGFVDDPARNAILMSVRYDNGETGHLLPPEGIAIGDEIEVGVQGKLKAGSVLPLYRVPDGAYVYNIERRPGDGGKFVRSPGSYAIVVSKEGKYVYLKLPSKSTVMLLSECRAQLGVAAGGGRLECPLLTAGNAWRKWRARGRMWPTNRGVHMSAYCHPHGGKQHHVGKPTTVARGTPPGGKVGHIAARRTGRGRGKKPDQTAGGEASGRR